MLEPHHPDTDSSMLEEYFETKLSAEIDAASFASFFEEGEEPFVVDVRDPESFEEGHVRGAINIPAESLQDHLDEFPEDEPIYVYCYDHECLLSSRVCWWLAREGYQPRDILGGWEKLQEKGAPIRTGSPEREKAPTVGGHN